MIGWTYEADQDAVVEAQNNLEELENQKQAEDVQYQIDLLNKINEIIEDVSSNEEWKVLKEEYEAAFAGEDIKGMATFLAKWDNEWGSEKLYDSLKNSMTEYFDNNIVKVQVMQQQDAVGELNEAYENLQRVIKENGGGLDTYNPYDVNDREKIEKYNAAVDKVRAAANNAQQLGVTDGTFSNFVSSGNYGALSGQTLSGLQQKTKAEEEPNYFTTDAKFLTTNALFGAANKYVRLYKDSPVDSIMPMSYVIYGMDGNRLGIVDEFIKNNKNNIDSNLYKKWENNPGKGTYISQILNNLGYNSTIISHVGGKEILWSNGATGIYKAEFVNKKNHELDINNYYDQDTGEIIKTRASGDLNFSGGKALINEKGIEGIITPQGTLTALPAHTGIIPADLTRNLYELGKAAPVLVKNIKDNSNDINYKFDDLKHSDSLNIGNIYTDFEADDNFDFAKFMTQVRQNINMRRHLNNV